MGGRGPIFAAPHSAMRLRPVLRGVGGAGWKMPLSFAWSAWAWTSFFAGVEMFDARQFVHGGGDFFGEIEERGGCVGADVEGLVIGGGIEDGAGDEGGDVADVGEGAGLGAVAEDGHGFAGHELVHKDADDVSIAVAEVLVGAVGGCGSGR